METKYRTGLERFMDKFPYWSKRKELKREDEFEYLGVGAMMVPIICKGYIASQNESRKT